MEALGGEDCFVIAQLLFNQAVNHAHTKHFYGSFIISQNLVSGGILGKRSGRTDHKKSGVHTEKILQDMGE